MFSRRELFVALGALALGCKRGGDLPASCTDVSGLSATDVETRNAMGYRDESGNPFQTCQDCSQYIAATKNGECGKCSLIKGPIHPKGFCRAFTSKG